MEKVLSLEKMKERYQSPEYIPVTFDMETQMVAESPNLYIANLPKEQQEFKGFCALYLFGQGDNQLIG